MAIPLSRSQPLLCHYTDSDDVPDVQGGGSGGGLCPRSSGAQRIMHSCSSEDILLGGSGDDADAYFERRRHQTDTGYVSFEDVIGSEAFRRDDGDAPLVRTAARLRSPVHPRHPRRSPGPLGTRRGGAMHWFVKKYVHPCLGFLVGAFCMPGGVEGA